MHVCDSVARVYDRCILDPTRIGQLRLAKGLSKRALAERAGLSPISIIKAESGKPVLLSSAAKIAEALGVPLPSIVTTPAPAPLEPSVPPAQATPLRVVRRPREAWAMQNTPSTRGAMITWLTDLGWRVHTDGPDVVLERSTGPWHERHRVPPGYCVVAESGMVRILAPTDFDEIYTVWCI